LQPAGGLPAPAPPGRSEGDASARLDRWRVPAINAATRSTSAVGNEKELGGPAFAGSAATVKPYFGTEENHEHQTF
jgi:hypothetical protein